MNRSREAARLVLLLGATAGCGGGTPVCRAFVTGSSTTSETMDSQTGPLATYRGGSTTSCSFDKGTLTSHCTTTFARLVIVGGTPDPNPGPALIVEGTLTWATLEDAAAPHLPIGREAWIHAISADKPEGPCGDVIMMNAYDSSKRLLSTTRTLSKPSSTCAVPSVAYNTWDAQGRPTKGVSTTEPSVGPCTVLDQTFSYDDGARTLTIVESGSGECPRQFSTEVYRYDANGNEIGSTLTRPNLTSTSTTTILAATQLCSD